MLRGDLKAFLDREHVDPTTYAMDGRVPNECYCLIWEAGMWHVFYSERGLRTGERVFTSEEEACEHLLDLLITDAPRV
jgi:hypothetical protein